MKLKYEEPMIEIRNYRFLSDVITTSSDTTKGPELGDGDGFDIFG